MFKATEAELVHNATTRCGDVLVLLLQDRVENKTQTKNKEYQQ
jgi:hypothetical protein